MLSEAIRQNDRPLREIRATYSAELVVVYQAYPESIAVAALGAQRFVPPFKLDRMTWIKPSFLWMMYRSGWGEKPGQERVLRISVPRQDFDWLLKHAVLSHFVPEIHQTEAHWRANIRASSVVVQWDPERDLMLRPLSHRTIQIGLRGQAAQRYATKSELTIEDVTHMVGTVRAKVATHSLDAASNLLSEEQTYPVPPDVARRLAITGY